VPPSRAQSTLRSGKSLTAKTVITDGEKVAHLPQNYWLVRIALGYPIAAFMLSRHIIELIMNDRGRIDDHRNENCNFSRESKERFRRTNPLSDIYPRSTNI